MTETVRPHAVDGLYAGRYRLGTVLGRGSVAEVRRAEDTLLCRPVAIKMFRGDVAEAADPRRHSGEIRVLAALNHPGLVTLFDAGTEPGPDGAERPYLVMELVDGPSLASRLADGPLPAVEAAALGAELADTLDYVHAQGVVHRDIKPANILLETRPDGTCAPRLADFGIARLVDGTRMTQVGMTVGTANYLSPEQALGLEVDSASDVYALGLVLLECLTGRTEFQGVGVAAAAARLHRDPLIPRALPAGWRELLAAMTAREAGARPSAGQVATELRALAADPDATVVLPAVPAAYAAPQALAEKPQRRRNLAVPVLAAVAVAAIAGLITVLAMAPSTSSTPPPAVPPSQPPAAASTSTPATSRAAVPVEAAKATIPRARSTSAKPPSKAAHPPADARPAAKHGHGHKHGHGSGGGGG